MANILDCLKKDKKGTAARILKEWCDGPPALLRNLLDELLNPRKALNDREAIDCCRWLMAGGRTPDDFCAAVLSYDNAATCGLVWTAHFVAYRCRTCGISPCMSLCASCFQNGNHEGHDFNMFRSQAGGACDCGDVNVMKESGFCSKHGLKAHLDKPSPPPDLLCIAEYMLPRLLLRLVLHFRDRNYPESCVKTVLTAEPFLTLLHQLTQLGAAMRHIIARALINLQHYKDLMDGSTDDKELEVFVNNCRSNYTEALKSLHVSHISEDSEFVKRHNNVTHRSFLDELVFWTVMYEFPQELVCFLLSMLPDEVYKDAFTRAFISHYPATAEMLVKSEDHDKLSSRVVHVSVQLFSNEPLSVLMTEELDLLHVMVISLIEMMKRILVPCTLHEADKNFHLTVDCNHRIMKDHRYWTLLSDVNNVLSHKSIALKFLSDNSLLEKWFDFLCMFQGMNASRRELHEHVKYEKTTYYGAFSAELEASASIMWALLANLKDPSKLHLTKQVLTYCLTALQDWFDALGFPNTDMVDPLQVSFHIPLHRNLALFINQAVRYQGEDIKNVLPSTEMLKNLMIHALKIQVVFSEILCGMWVRNGLQMKGQTMTYIQCHFCNSMVDADIFLLQLCATHVDPDWFIMTVLERFHILNWFSFDSNRTVPEVDPDHIMPLLEGVLIFLASLLSIRTVIGLEDDELTKLEMVTLLCIADKTHSQLMDLMPDKCGSGSQNKNFESTLARVADYKAPNFEAGGNMLQGMYMPKAEVWEHDYDPIYVMLRGLQKRDFQASLDRFSQFVRQNGKTKGSRTLWPPFRIPGPVHSSYDDPRKLLHCKTMHGVLFTILHKSLHDATVSDLATSLCIYLLDMAVRFPAAESVSGKELLHVTGNNDDEVSDLQFKDWFNGSFILTNLHQAISKVLLPSESGDSNRMEIDSYSEGDEDDSPSILGTPPYNVNEAGTPEGNVLFGHATPLSLPPPSSSRALIPVTSESNMMVVQSEEGTMAFPSVSNHFTLVSNSRMYLPVSPPLALTSPRNEPSFSTNRVGKELVPKVCCPVGVLTSHPGSLTLNKQLSGEDDIVFLKSLPAAHSNYVEVNESILSLLLKLHSKLTGKLDSYLPPECRSDLGQGRSESRIGDGPHFIGILLDKICQLSHRNSKAIQEIRKLTWPPKQAETIYSASANDITDQEERKKKVLERQQTMLDALAKQRKTFVENLEGANTTIDDDMDSIYNDIQYDCAICGTSSPSTEENPIGLVCLLQATSVLGYSTKDPSQLQLPCTEGEIIRLRNVQRRSLYMNRRIEELGRNFDDVSRLMSVNIGWEGGVFVKTCGHHLHLNCHKSYITTLQQAQNPRQLNLSVNRGEYWCPLCRQLSNAVLPVTPNGKEVAAVVKSRSSNSSDVVLEFLQLLNSCPPAPKKSNLITSMSCIMEGMTNVTYPQYKICSSSQCLQAFCLFISSIARTNLELEVMLRGGNLCGEPNSRYPEPSVVARPCFLHLLHVLSTHAKILQVKLHSQLGPQITGLQVDENLSSLSRREKEVPLLLKDITTLLLHLILALPIHIDKAYFNCIVCLLYNIVYTQAIAFLSCQMSEEQRLHWKEFGRLNSSPLNTLAGILGEVIDNLEHCALYLQDDDLDREIYLKKWSLAGLEAQIRDMCIPFIRIAALLQHHIYKDYLPVVMDASSEFDVLSTFLGLGKSEVSHQNASEPRESAAYLTWIVDDGRKVLQNWCHELIAFVNTAQIAARSLLDQHPKWARPRLLRLPHHYDQIFQFYHQRACSRCNGIPKEPSVCLVCGALVCLREECCRHRLIGEAVQHSINCGAGTAMFLAVNSSTIIVIREKRACLWGSVYLDSFGEEDRDLKRGKPLFLSEERYQLLEQQWLTHSFDHTNKRWIFHKDSL